MHPERLLPWLLGGAIGAAGILEGIHSRATSTPETTGSKSQGDRISSLEAEVALLKRENESLRSLSQGGGEVAVAPEMARFVEAAIELDFKSSPVIHRLPVEELRERIAAAIEARYGPNGLDSRQQAWTLMGFLGPDDRFESQLAAMDSINTRSWFDESSGDAWVTDRFDSRNIPDQAALIRSLSLILTHQHYPPQPGWSGDESAMARETLHEGAARVLEERYLAKEALHSGFTGVAPNTEDRALTANLPLLVQGMATFPAMMGTPRANRLFDQEELLGAFFRPPAVTADYFPGHEEIIPQPPDLGETPGNEVLEESMGMLGLSLWLEPLGETGGEIADGWIGDRYRLYAIDDITVNLRWDIRFSSAEKATDFFTAAAPLVEKLQKLPANEGRKLHLDHPSPDTVRLVNEVD